MNKTKIEWCDYTINPIKGLCKNKCWYCYAKSMYKRFKWDTHIRQDFSVFNDLTKIETPSRVFVGSMHDIFGKWIPHHWINDIIVYCSHPILRHHTFIFLTKFSERYEDFNFPKNCWLGTSITGTETEKELIQKYDAMAGLYDNKRFISFEPLIKMPSCFSHDIDWIIIGGLTGSKYIRPNEAVNEIIIFYTFHDIPIFIKPNLKWDEKIQEYPLTNNHK